jgi:nucleotide-binding universal stress UspA family protein
MKILLATDGSEYSDNAARFLTRFNWTPADSISVFHAIYAIPFRSDQKFYFSQLQAIKKELAPRIMDAAFDALKPVRAAISGEIEEGPPNQCAPESCIMTAAEKSGADLIVMGARGLKGIGSVFVGSVTREVAINSAKPVLIVRPPAQPASSPVRILLATDGSDCSHATTELLASIPFSENAEITIANIHSSSFSDIPERYALEVNERIKEVVAGSRTLEFAESEKIINQARQTLSKRFKLIHVLPRTGDPSTEIVKAGNEAGADIIAVGSRGLRGIKGLLGSVSRNVMNHAGCSVLIGKSQKC